MKRSIALFLSLILLLSAFAGAASAESSVDPRFAERVTLNVALFIEQVEPDGKKTDPVTRYIEDKLNVDLNITCVNDSDWTTQLTALMAANDLPDVFMVANVQKQYHLLKESKQILAMDEYLEEYAKNTLSTEYGQEMIRLYRADDDEGKLYMYGSVMGAMSDGTMPSSAHAIRWDLYKQAGYPKLESYDEDLLDVMEKMVALEPQTADGLKTYGTGAWFGDGQGWGDWLFNFGFAPQQGIMVLRASDRTVMMDTETGLPLPTNQLTDPNGYFWRTVQFYNRANQRGLLDPDSFTQTSDIYEEKVKSGVYMFVCPGWMANNANKVFASTPGNLKRFVSVPAIGSDKEDRISYSAQGERAYAISSKTKYPERCVALLDLMGSEEFSLIAYNGPEGINWNYDENGVPVPTDEYIKADRTDNEFRLRTGAYIYHHFVGLGQGNRLSDSGVFVDLYNYSAKASELNMDDTLRDFIRYYGAESHADVYPAQTPVYIRNATETVANPPDDLAMYVTSLGNYVFKNVFKVIAAPTDEGFAKARDKMIEGMQDYCVDEIFDFYYNAKLEEVQKKTEAK